MKDNNDSISLVKYRRKFICRWESGIRNFVSGVEKQVLVLLW